ncbi:O-methyltransferase [Xylaria arbuscula]|nr:O-methyltransferase [Xylaria arbuscula]
MDSSVAGNTLAFNAWEAPGTLKGLASKLVKQTELVDAYLRSFDYGQPSFDADAAELPDTAEYNALRGEVASTLDELKCLIDGPKRYLRGLLMTGNDLAAFQVAFEFKFFQFAPLHASIDVGVLATKAGMDVERATRVLRMLTTHHVFMEPRPGHFCHTATSAMLHHDEEVRSAGHYMLDECLRAATMSSACIKKSPHESDSVHSPFHAFFGVPMFAFYEQNSALAARFTKAMAGTTKLDRQASELRDEFRWGELQGTVVDVGGGNGHVSVALARAFSSLNFLVQDNSDVMLAQGGRLLEPSLQCRCTHNWSDIDLVTILRSLVPGLESSGPRTPLLINDTVMPVPGSRPLVDERALRQLDILMFVVLGAKQRSAAEFERVLKMADERYEIKKVYFEGTMGLIEVQLQG